MLSEHYRVRLSHTWPDGQDTDVLLALHARKSADSVLAWKQAHPDRLLVLALTGTDLYRDIHDHTHAQRALALADRLIVLQDQGLSVLPVHLQAKTRVLYQSSTPRKTLAKTSKHLRAVMVGHLRDEKWPQVLWQAVAHIAPDEGILIDHMGEALDPALGQEAQRMARHHPHYRWLGGLSFAATRAHIQRAHVLVHTSRMEGGAHVIMEAVLSGTPVLASRISGNVGMLGVDYPGYFEPGDSSALAHALRMCRQTLGHPHSQIQHLQQACQTREPLFLPEREKANLLALIHDSLSLANG